MQWYTMLPQIKYFHLQKNSPTLQILKKPFKMLLCCRQGHICGVLEQHEACEELQTVP